MPGLVGVFSAHDVVTIEQERFSPPRLGRLQRVTYDSRVDGVLGGVFRVRPVSSDAFVTEEQSLAIYGHCIDRRTGQQYAMEWSHRYQDEGKELLYNLEGAFHVVIWDHMEKALTIINDRLAILPFYWYCQPGLFAFAPRIKYLPSKAADGPPNPAAVVCFLSMGHLLGPSTLVQNVNMLTAASVLHVDLRSHEVRQHHYWNLRYDADRKLTKNDHLHRLGHAIQESVQLMTTDPPSRHGIFLTGGWDSRSLLGASMALSRPPALVVTNGYTDKIPNTDTHMARSMAEELGLEFRFCKRNPEVPSEQWLHGIQLGEIVTDLNPETFGQHLLPQDYFLPVDYMLKGDVTWGSGSPAIDETTSIRKCVAYPADPKSVCHN